MSVGVSARGQFSGNLEAHSPTSARMPSRHHVGRKQRTVQRETEKMNNNKITKRENMEIKIERFWTHDNNVEMLCKRPRVDYRISEYLFDFINQHILTEKRLCKTGTYDFTLFLKVFNPEEHKFFFDNPYDTEFTKYAPSIRHSIKSKINEIFCSSALFNAQMTAKEYVAIVYDMFAFYFILRYKKLTKALFDELKQKIDYDYVNSFEFPATFENQKYILDDSSIGINPVYDKKQREWVSERIFCIKDEYLKYFGK